MHGIYYEISNIVRNRIVSVNKENNSGTTTDSLWLLSVEEYKRYSSNNKIHFFGNESFWLRNAIGHGKFYMAGKNGGLIKILSNVKDGVLVGFCTN